MKKFSIALLTLAFLAGPLAAVDLGACFYLDFELLEDDQDFDISVLRDYSFMGMRIDVPVSRNISLLVLPEVKFEEIPEEEEVSVYNKNIHWNGQFGPEYHIFGFRSFIDPFVGTGVSCTGAQYFDAAHAGDWRDQTQLVVSHYVNAGVNFVFHRDWYVGFEAQWIASSFNPSPLNTYGQFPLGARFNFGFRL